MQVVEELEKIAPDSDVVASVGVFDGVHIGHQELLRRAVARAQEAGCLSAAITFHPHPRAVLGQGIQQTYLNDLPERLGLIKSLGIDVVATLTFTPQLACLSAQEFVQLISSHLRVKELVVGDGFALGRHREGTVEVLRSIGEQLGFTVNAVGPVVVGGAIVSSSRIRDLLRNGDVARAQGLLGRRYSLGGLVVLGAGRGRAIGFPTANIAVPPERTIPLDGVYVVYAYIRGESRPAVTSIGTRPTFDNGLRTVEVHILDFDEDIYGQELKIEFVSRLRGEERFASVAALVAQIEADVVAARKMLLGRPDLQASLRPQETPAEP
ncbi:MAG: bifunctional riboflavin kinase/FAD synthetase [Chloroflexi bacterium]|nr:bifunctional riboflavin kinase/FAD synthetase [Chloroflexota bacterium]